MRLFEASNQGGGRREQTRLWNARCAASEPENSADSPINRAFPDLRPFSPLFRRLTQLNTRDAARVAARVILSSHRQACPLSLSLTGASRQAFTSVAV